MRILLSIFIAILFLQGNIVSAQDQIVAIVGKEPITLSELEQRKKLMRFFNNISSLSAEQEKAFTSSVLQTMIDDKVLAQYGEKSRILVNDQEVTGFIRNVEANNKMSPGQLERMVMNAHVTPAAFHDKMRSEVLRSKIIQMLGNQITVSKKDVDSLILDTNSRDAMLSLKVFTARRMNDKSYKSMSKLSSRAKSCNNTSSLRYHSFARMEELNTTLSELPANVQGVVKDLSAGQATGVIKDDKLKVYLLCSKNIQGFSDNDANQLSQMVGHKQLNTKARKFLQDLRKKAYVKIMM